MIDAPSPNHGARRDGLRPSLVVLHYTAMATAEAALARLRAPEHEVSAHYLIGADGRVWRLVDEDRRAWHAGAGAWGGAGDVNSRSIGIELDNRGDHPFAAPQIAALESLLAGVLARHGIGPAGVIGHADLAPERKSDPGPRFDWRRLARRGLAVWPRVGAPDVGDASEWPDRFARAAARFGYPADSPRLLPAVRARFRPRAHGAAAGPDGWDVALIEDLARRHPFPGALS
ncbi:N-acetylmuramoyl-L-alanine amidase [Rhodobacteraceae bacterium 2CG4]|uniref:N-acetylmuramoyl-L-alanine amidase n=1 Tax=Halovulum marinum TaxID=2662447 RepID=A0A6L5Z0G2_9RHOB|nr:N-acetylmuramoyl-L-alanine amidase [Halovulum marinum]MSU89799.1 N-acetylmuramoyl-L-alanine amidase [Halovulum marinum]